MLIAVGSLKGSPGATTLGLALADRWPADVDPVVVEADPAGGDLVARFGLAPTRGLVSVAAAARRTASAELLWDHTQQLPGGLRVVAAPAGAEQTRAVLGELAGGEWSLLRAAADDMDVAVIVDCGRLDPQSPVLSLLRVVDVLLLVVRARDDELAHLAAKLGVVAGWRLPAWYLIIVGQPGKHDGYRVADIMRVLDAHVLGPVPYDPAAAAVLAGLRRTRTGITRSRLGRAAAELAGYLTSHVDVADRDVPAAQTGPPPAGLPGLVAFPQTGTGLR
jgi:hypothetical protein